jgi:hypothetical protein
LASALWDAGIVKKPRVKNVDDLKDHGHNLNCMPKKRRIIDDYITQEHQQQQQQW